MTRPASRPVPGSDDYWNHNTHYHGLVLSMVPRGCDRALDVGCGDGLLVRKLAGRAQHVTGLDVSAEMVDKARALAQGVPNVEFVEADLLAYELPSEGLDFVCSVAAIHHMDFAAGLTAMRDALRPGGGLAVISLAKNGRPQDLLTDLGGAVSHRYHLLRNRGRLGNPGAPIADPDMTWAEVRDEALRLLPGATFRRHLLWRYSITWQKPR